MKCPDCGLTYPPNAIRCDCGFNFKTGVKYVLPEPSARDTKTSIYGGVIIKDIDMPFGSMIKFMVKWALASIPAIIILTIIVSFCMSLIMGVVAGITGTLVGMGGS